MHLRAFNYGVNVVAFIKNRIKYGMTCSWAMQVDYDKICLLIGEQSITGDNIEVGDTIGVSALNNNQKLLGLHFGENHSNKVDKFINIKYHQNSSALLIDNAKVMMIVEVNDIVKLKGIENDRLVYGKIIDYEKNEDSEFLSLNEI